MVHGMNITQHIFFKKRMTIMLIDSDRNQHERFREIVRRLDPAHLFLKAFSTESALDILLDTEGVLPDLIFLDLQFRAGSGKKMLKDLKGSATLQHIPVCVYTDSAEDADRESTRKLGAIGYIVKEANLTNLSASIQSVIHSQ